MRKKDFLSQTSDSFWRVILSIVLAIVLLPFLFILGKIIDVIRLRRYRRRRKTTLWQAPVSNDDFLRGCGIAPDSREAEVAIKLRDAFAGGLYKRHTKLAPEDIAPDMTCGELCFDVEWHIYFHDDITFESIGYYAVQNLCKGRIPKEALNQLIRPEKKSRVTMRQLFRNYLDVIMPYLADAGGTEAGK